MALNSFKPLLLNQMYLPPNSLCSNGGKIFVVHNFQKRVNGILGKRKEGWETNATRFLGMTECMMNCTNVIHNFIIN